MGITAATKTEIDAPPAAGGAYSSAIVVQMNADANGGSADTEAATSQLATLLVAVSNNDRAAFDAFYDATSERALNIVLRITQQIDVAEEVVSDVYLQVWHQAGRFDPARGNALAWLTIICRSRALDAVRRNQAVPTHGATQFSEVPEPGSDEFPQDLLIATERHSAVHTALELLEPDQRQLLALAFFRGYSHNELAEFTGLPLGTVKTQLRRTLQKLKELMLASENQKRESA